MRWSSADWVLTSADERIRIDWDVRCKSNGDVDEVLHTRFSILCTRD